MWAQALPLALAASIYPPALVTLVVLLRRDPFRGRALAYLAGAAATTFVAGAVLLVGFGAARVDQHDRHGLSAGVDIGLGLALVALAWWVHSGGRGDRPARDTDDADDDAERGVAGAFVLGGVMYLPSVLWISAVKEVAAAGLAFGAAVLTLAVLSTVVVSMTAIPVAAALRWPAPTRAYLHRLNALMSRHGRSAVAIAALLAGVGLIVKGLVNAA